MTFFCANGWCQVKDNSLVGKFLHKDQIGGGFTRGPNNECMSIPPDYTINTTLIIDSNWVVTKLSDTTAHPLMLKAFVDRGCDTLYVGTATIIADTLVATYTLKPICKTYFSVNKTGKNKRYEKLKAAIIEKYVVEVVAGDMRLVRSTDGREEEYYKESEAYIY